MKKLLPLLILFLMAVGAVHAAIDTLPIIIVPIANTEPPVNSAISPVDISTSAGYQGKLYQADINASPGVSPRILIYNTNQSSYPLSKTAIGPATLGGTPRGMAVSPDGENLWVSLDSTNAVKVFTKTGSYVGSTTGVSFGGPKQIAVAPDGKRVYVVDSVNYKIYVFDASTRAKVAQISASYVGLFGVAVSPDNTKLAVTVMAESGRVLVYDIDRDTSGDISGYSLANNYTGNGCEWPTYVAFDAASERIFVRVHENNSPYRDVLIYNVGSTLAPQSITLENASGGDLDATNYDLGNKYGEALTLSKNGKYLYLTHYVASTNKVFAYRMPTYNSDDSKRSNWEFSTSSSVGDSIVRQDLAPSGKDSIAFQPDGARIWFTFRRDGNDPIYTRWTGFTDGSGNLTNALPGAPDIIHPETPDNMTNYTGNAEWAAGEDDSPSSGYRYEVQYRGVDEGASSWHTLLGFTANTTTSLASLTQGEWYLLRVRMFDGANWSEYTYSDPFKKGGAIITGIQIDTNRSPSAQTWQNYNSSSNIGYIYDAIRINGSGFGTVSNPWVNGDGETNQIVFQSVSIVYIMGIPTPIVINNVIPGYKDNNDNDMYDSGDDKIITSWTDTQIEMIVPRKFKGGSLLMPKEYGVKIRTQGELSSDTFAFKVGPVITSMTPTSGPAGTTTVNIYGAGFGASQGSNTVKFYNDKTASVSLWSSDANSDHITCTVPSTATDGRVLVNIGDIPTSVNYAGNEMGSYNLPVTFDVTTAVTPTITGFQVDTNPDPLVNNWVDTTDAIVYDHIKIMGTNFGADPGDGNRDTATNRVTLAGNVIRDDAGNDGLQVYAWSNTAIEIGIPRRVSSTFINAGANAVIVRAGGVDSASSDLNIKPYVYSVTPDEGFAGTTSTVVAGTALQGSAARTVYFDTTSAGSGTIVREDGDDPDGTLGTDNVTVTVPGTLTPGLKNVSVAIGSLTSNTDMTFNVLEPGAPDVIQIIPNSAPNTAGITATVHGLNFESGATVVLQKMGETDIAGVVTYIDPTELSVELPITGAAIGKWDVVVTNPSMLSDTLEKGFTVTDGSQEIAQIIDDFEGVAVLYPSGYTFFPASDSMALTMSTSDVYEGAQSGSASYPISTVSYRGYNGHLSTMQNITDFTTIIVAVKGDGGVGSVKVQLTDVDGHNFEALGYDIALSGTSWTKYTIPLSAFTEIGVGGHDLNKAGITDYQLVFTGAAASITNIMVDYVAAGGYSPVASSDVTTTIARDGDTVGSGINISWVYNDTYTGNADIYTISGAWDSSSDVFTTDASLWTLEFANVASPVTDTSTSGQVGAGTQKYYKVVKTGTTLTNEMLEVDVAGKFDVGLTEGYNMVSLPIVVADSSIASVIGTQLQAGAVPPLADKIYKQKPDKTGYEQAWLNSLDNQWYDADTMAISTMEISNDVSFWFELTVGHASAMPTLVGTVSTNNRFMSITAGHNFTGNSFPVRVAVGSSNLRESGATAGAVPPLAAKVYSFKADKSGFDQAWLNSVDNQWYDADTMAVSTMELIPGKGYIVEEVDTVTPYTWQYTKPY